MARVVLAMSGGVDSSVAAHLLRRAGHDVVGLFMRHGEAVESCASADAAASPPPLAILPPRASHKQGCCSASDAADARRVADRFEIPFYALDFSDAFGRIIDYFVAEYRAARTPNPCVMCNNWLKFGKLFDYADSVGAEFVATGHYARLTGDGDRLALRRGLDAGKDQSYVLFGVARHLLPRMMLPVGDFRKDEIRGMAHELGLRVADKKDSQEICFVAAGEHAEFVRRRATDETEDRSGQIVTTDGAVVGQHNGLEGFTIGQRKGLRVALGEARYVVRLEPDTRRVVIGSREDLARNSFTARQSNWLVDPPADSLRCLVQIRYTSRPAPAVIEPLPEGRLSIALDEPLGGIAPGQAVVCYDGDRVLGGGWIER
ncbi:MAG TPA: tRNA 2-thiouridine(34) synthase MnmA [Pirellulales bacterium]|nr:tRNA 2-thiouridine(34) synthase MnmA [Pirellulales bacterium]